MCMNLKIRIPFVIMKKNYNPYKHKFNVQLNNNKQLSTTQNNKYIKHIKKQIQPSQTNRLFFVFKRWPVNKIENYVNYLSEQ